MLAVSPMDAGRPWGLLSAESSMVDTARVSKHVGVEHRRNGGGDQQRLVHLRSTATRLLLVRPSQTLLSTVVPKSDRRYPCMRVQCYGLSHRTLERVSKTFQPLDLPNAHSRQVLLSTSEYSTFKVSLRNIGIEASGQCSDW